MRLECVGHDHLPKSQYTGARRSEALSKKAAFRPKRKLEEISQKSTKMPEMCLKRINDGRRMRFRMKLITQDAINRRRAVAMLVGD